jgi:hypothetical protein
MNKSVPVWVFAVLVFGTIVLLNVALGPSRSGPEGQTIADTVITTTVSYADGGGASAVGAARVDVQRTVALQADPGGELTRARALDVARAYLGSAAADAVPFRVPGEPRQHIAVLREYGPGQPDGVGQFGVVVLRGARGSYETVRTRLDAYGPAPVGDGLFGVADVDADGLPELYAVSRELGTAGYLVEVGLHELGSESRWEISVGGAYADARREVEWRGGGDDIPAVAAWLRERAFAVVDAVDDGRGADSVAAR